MSAEQGLRDQGTGKGRDLTGGKDQGAGLEGTNLDQGVPVTGTGKRNQGGMRRVIRVVCKTILAISL
jgi:hypothetical protein